MLGVEDREEIARFRAEEVAGPRRSSLVVRAGERSWKMAPEFRYSLTRICLRTGQLSLSQRMAEVFPESGMVRAFDTVDDRELELEINEPRKVSGLGRYIERHRLDVNDEIQIRLRDDGRIGLTAMPRRTRKSFDENIMNELLDSLKSEAPLTEAEIRALHPQIPDDYPLAEALAAHPRLRLRGGRWMGESGPEARPEDPVDHETLSAATDWDRDAGVDAAMGASFGPTGDADLDAAMDVALYPTADKGLDAVSEQEGDAAIEGGQAAEDGVEPASAQPAADATETDSEPDSPARASRTRSDRFSEPESGRPARDARSARDSNRFRERGQPGRPAAVTPYPRGVLFPGEAALNSQRPAGDLRLVNRAREALTGFGYRVEGLPHGMLLAKADLGRRKHTVLVRVLADGERLDWAALLARRREQTADYLAVVGDHRDLHRLTAPAELARASLWSWDGIARIQNLAKTVLIGPFDLEPHFAKDGMFENGLKQFERTLGRMIAEKGALSAVIARLGSLRAPAVFVLDDLVEGDLQREQVAKALDLLAQAPFHLVARIDRGEYCLRHPVAESLAHLSEYAVSLGERLPGARGRNARFTASAGGAAERRRDLREHRLPSEEEGSNEDRPARTEFELTED